MDVERRGGLVSRTLGVLIVAAASLLFNLRPLSLAMPAPDLDGSWMVVMGQAATVPMRWGVDLAFTYGPASALVTRYFTESYLSSAVPATLAIALMLGLCLSRVSFMTTRGYRRASLLAIAFAGVQAAGLLAAADAPDNIFFIFAFCIFMLDIVRPPLDRTSCLTTVASSAVMGGVALSKTSYGILALALFALSDLRSAALLRRPPLLLPAFAASFLSLYGAFGQRFGDLPTYLARQGEVAGGYGAAMYAPGSLWELSGFVAAAAGLLLVECSGPLRGDRFRGGFAAAGTALLLLLVFKAGFVRQDAHTGIGWTTLGLCGLVVAVALGLRRSATLAASLTVASLAVLWIVDPLMVDQNGGDAPRRGLTGFYADVEHDALDEAGAWLRFLRHPAAFAAAASADKERAFREIREKSPLPKLNGTVDILPSEQTSVLANGLDYHPRPSFQDYSTYTSGLIDANVAFFRGASAPDWMLFGVGGLDDRYPTLTEGALWPDLLRRYEPVQSAGDLLALHRRTVPLPDVLGPPQERSVLLGQRFAVPAGPTFARIMVHETLLGRVASTLFRPPALALDVRFADGREDHTRFIPALGAGGFLISPAIDSAEEYEKLADGEPDAITGKTVIEASITGSRFVKLFYEKRVSLDFRSVTVNGHTKDSQSHLETHKIP